MSAPPDLSVVPGDVDQIMDSINTQLTGCALHAKKSTKASGARSHIGWKKLAAEDDSKKIWQAINWNGSVVNGKNDEMPSDEEFKQHFENLLSPPEAEIAHPVDGPHIPLTDDPFSPEEVDTVIRKLKPNRSGGPSGIPRVCWNFSLLNG